MKVTSILDLTINVQEHYPQGVLLKKGNAYEKLCDCAFNGVEFYLVQTGQTYFNSPDLKIDAVMIGKECFK